VYTTDPKQTLKFFISASSFSNTLRVGQRRSGGWLIDEHISTLVSQPLLLIAYNFVFVLSYRFSKMMQTISKWPPIGFFLMFCVVVIVFGDPDPGPSCAIPASAAVLPLADGDNWFNTRSMGEGITVIDGAGLCGSKGLVLEPTPNRLPYYTLFAADPPAYRSNFMLFDALQLWVSCQDESTWQELTVLMSHWVGPGSPIPGNSPKVYLKNFRDSSSENWSRVRIPLMAFWTKNWTLGGVESLFFDIEGQQSRCVIDNVELLSLSRPRIGTAPFAFAETSNVIWFNLTKRYDLASARDFNNYRLTAVGDRDHDVPSSGIQPVDVGSSIRFYGFNADNMPMSSFSIYLKFDLALKEGVTYQLYVGPGLTDMGYNPVIPASLNLTYTDFRETIAVQPNQEGYLPHGQKLAYVNGYQFDMGSAVFAVSAQGTILSRDKYTGTWSTMKTDRPYASYVLRGIAALSETNAVAVGDDGLILSLVGDTWMQVPSGTSATLHAVTSNHLGDYYAVGEEGIILRLPWQGQEWKVFSPSLFESFLSLTSATIFRAVFAATDGSILVGGEGVVFQYVAANSVWYSIGGIDANVVTSICGGALTKGQLTILLGLNGMKSKNVYGAAVPIGPSYSIDWHSSWSNDAVLGEYLIVGSNGTAVLGNGFGDEQIHRFPTNQSLNSVDCMDGSFCVIVGAKGTVFTGPKTVSPSAWQAEDIPGMVDLMATVVVRPGSLRLTTSQLSISLISADAPYAEVAIFDLELRRANDQLSGGDVWTVNFTDFTSAGSYRLLLPGIGMSVPFDVNDAALTATAWHSCRSFYYQRSGLALQEPFAEHPWIRSIDHEFDLGGRTIDAAYHESLVESPLYKGEKVCPLVNRSCSLDSMKDMSGGWFDAGDYSKYLLNAFPTVWRMLNSFEMYPEDYDDDWNIPESGNGIADLLDEVKWELDWMEKMQTDDGGVYNKIASQFWESGLPQVSDLGGYSVRYILPQSTEITAGHGAIMAQAARIFAEIDPQLAKRYLQRALNASDFLMKYTTQVPTAGFVDPPGLVSGNYNDNDDRDNRCFLSAELFRTTCQSRFADQFEELFNDGFCGIGWNDMSMYGDKAIWAYYYAECPGVAKDDQILVSIYSNFRTFVLQMLDNADANSYLSHANMEIFWHVTMGALGGVYNAQDLLRGLYMFPDMHNEILNAITNQVDIALGANPLAISFITGVGDHSAHHPLHWTRYQAGEPVPGIGVFGPAAHMSFSNPYYKQAYGDDNNYPSLEQEDQPFPVFRRYADTFFLPDNSEFAIGSMGPQCSIFMHLKNSSFAAFQPKVVTSGPSNSPR
jgi:hypothetical protein